MTSNEYLCRIADALERLAPKPKPLPDFNKNNAFVWRANAQNFQPVDLTSVPLELLLGMARSKKMFVDNMERFFQGHPANHVLLWGARGTGKSSLVKAAFSSLTSLHPTAVVIEVLREDISSLQYILEVISDNQDYQFIVYCDDLSFEVDDIYYKSLKALLDGGLAGPPKNLLFCATSNRRHLLQRHMIENEQSTALSPSEAVEEKVSLSDRFGLWLGFHPMSQPEYLNIVECYAKHFKIKMPQRALKTLALEWSQTRGARSGRVAWQFIQSMTYSS